mmetsp:Transcript_22218/g.33097  ORF Transcript_22218/g.33097 Transcript_22218/m.33097 type:complete len:84 (+) Transcript_22218:620-871(+)
MLENILLLISLANTWVEANCFHGRNTIQRSLLRASKLITSQLHTDGQFQACWKFCDRSLDHTNHLLKILVFILNSKSLSAAAL